jgi:hypothetical protein
LRYIRNSTIAFGRKFASDWQKAAVREPFGAKSVGPRFAARTPSQIEDSGDNVNGCSKSGKEADPILFP